MINPNTQNGNCFTIYTEDFCINFGKDCKCKNCNPFSDLFNWLNTKNEDNKQFFEF